MKFSNFFMPLVLMLCINTNLISSTISYKSQNFENAYKNSDLRIESQSKANPRNTFKENKLIWLKHKLKAIVEEKSNGKAITGFVLGLLSLFIAGLILGLLGIIFSAVALKKIKQNPEKYSGRGLATAGLILGILGIVGWAVLILVLLK